MAGRCLEIRGVTEAYNDALAEQAQKNVWDTLADEATNMSALEYTTLTADIVGIFDPTPISDGVGTVLSLAQGDFLGAGLSLLGMVPYVGDLGKIGKIAKVAPRTARALETVLTRSDNLAKAGEAFLKNNFTLNQVAAAQAKAAERVQNALLAARRRLPNCQDCAKLPNQGKRQLQMPSTGGRWNPPDAPETGSGMFRFDEPSVLPDGRVVEEIEFRNGFPNFDDFVEGDKHSLWELTGNARTDGRTLTRMMRETDPSWSPPSRSDFVLHHFEDGQVGYVPRAVHDRGMGAPHTGGNSIVNNDLF
jgi:hypothetical protein